jgi:electron transfer flavoprotein beta subunit
MTFMRLIMNEFDEHALEQAVLLKEGVGGEVTIIAPAVDGADDCLYTAAAKGVDRLIKLTGEFESGVNNHALARAFATIIKDVDPDLVLTGVQSHDSLDGAIGPLLAPLLNMPYVGYVAGVTYADGKCEVSKEYPGGLIAHLEVALPAVLGIQAAEEPPRYIAISKVRQAQKTALIEEIPAGAFNLEGGLELMRLYSPEVAEKAEMLEGDIEGVAAKIVDILRAKAVL